MEINANTEALDIFIAQKIRFLSNPRLALERIGVAVQRSVQRTIKDKGTVDTGQLRDSIAYNIEGTDKVIVGSNKKYAAIQHYGGVIRPVNVRALPVPLSAKAKRAQRKVSSVREIKRLVYIPSDSGDTVGILGKKLPKNRGGGFEPWFALRKKVTIKGSGYMVLQVKDMQRARRIFLDELEKSATQSSI